MPIGIRCKQCQQKIILDEGFIGGYCRCPHCKSLTLAPPAGLDTGVTARPDRPAAPSRTEAADRGRTGQGRNGAAAPEEVMVEEYSPSPIRTPSTDRPLPGPRRKWAIILAIALIVLVALVALYVVFVR